MLAPTIARWLSKCHSLKIEAESSCILDTALNTPASSAIFIMEHISSTWRIQAVKHTEYGSMRTVCCQAG